MEHSYDTLDANGNRTHVAEAGTGITPVRDVGYTYGGRVVRPAAVCQGSRMLERTLIGMLAAVLLGCGCTGTTLTGYEFETSAVYVADKSGIALELHAQGAVAPGEDLGTGDVVGAIRVKNAAHTISFKTTAGALTELACGSGKARIASPDRFAASFTACLESLGRFGVDAAEMEELEVVINGAAAGPKGTYMKGQTRHLRVEKVELVRR